MSDLTIQNMQIRFEGEA